MEVQELDVSGYKPAELKDQAQPMLIWAEIDNLVVDHRYQRTITAAGRRAIQAMADDFDWKKYQPILVAAHADGRLAIVDGQHRAHAAKLCGLKTIPAMSVAMTFTEQAAGFVAINRNQIRVDNLGVFKAELACGAEWAEACLETVKEAGCSIATSNQSTAFKSPRTIYAILLIRKMVEGGERDAVIAGLRALSDSGMGEEHTSYAGPVLSVWLSALATNQTFLKLDLSSFLDRVDIHHVMDRAKIKSRATGEAAKRIAIVELIVKLKEFRG